MNLYVSPNNQKLLWKTMSRSPLFANRPAKEEWFKIIVGEFYENNKLNTTVSLKEINLHTINYMMKVLQEEGSRNQTIVYPGATGATRGDYMNVPPLAPMSATDAATATATAAPYTKQDLQNVRRNEFDTKLQQMENDHRALLQRNVPPEIDFRDKFAAEKDGPIANIGDLMKMEVEKRNRDIQQFAAARGAVSIAEGVGVTGAPSVVLQQVSSVGAAVAKKVSWSDNSSFFGSKEAAEHKVAVPMDYMTKISEVNETNHKIITEIENEVSEIRKTQTSFAEILAKISADLEFLKSSIESRDEPEEPPLLERTYESSGAVDETVSPMVVSADPAPAPAPADAETTEESSLPTTTTTENENTESEDSDTSVSSSDAAADVADVADATETTEQTVDIVPIVEPEPPAAATGKKKRKGSGRR